MVSRGRPKDKTRRSTHIDLAVDTLDFFVDSRSIVFSNRENIKGNATTVGDGLRTEDREALPRCVFQTDQILTQYRMHLRGVGFRSVSF
jgi:hypothetical protein